ncbi:zinc finger protein 836-like [Malaya genurostris]|uniref:zinc finger protein 836-like n=1 Tax=Malaya genurostris TaxID=325434 RepID=UPI0026F39FF3|nr:zinc finger protein 836-like [Malaya genurostris]
MEDQTETCRFCRCDGGASLKGMKSIFDVDGGTQIAIMIRELADVELFSETHRSESICIACLNKVRTGYLVRRMIREAEGMIEENVTNCSRSGPESLQDEFIAENEIKLEQMGTNDDENNDGFFYEYLEDENMDEDGFDTAPITTDDGAKRSAEVSLSSASKKLCLQRTYRKNKFTMPQEPTVLRITDRIDHFVVEVKGDRCCGCCFVGLTRKELLQHSSQAHCIEIVGSGNYCPICFFKFATEIDLTRHVDDCKSKHIFVCKICEKYFNQQRQIEAHLQLCRNADVNCQEEDFFIMTDDEYDYTDADVTDCNRSKRSEDETHGNQTDINDDSDDRDQAWKTDDECESRMDESSTRYSPKKRNYIFNDSFHTADCHGVETIDIPESLVVHRLTFKTFQYLKLNGERCCGCDFTCLKREQVFQHAKDTHQKDVDLNNESICPICYCRFADDKQLSKHINFITSKDVLICLICDEGFTGKGSLKYHQFHSEKHKQNLLSSCDGKKIDKTTLVELNDIDVMKAFDSEVTDAIANPKVRSRNNNRSLTRHRHLTMPDPIFIVQVDKYDKYEAITVTGERCCGCGQFFETYNELIQHGRRIHLIDNADAVGEYQCDICYGRFEWDRGLLMHQNTRRSISKLYHCTICQLVFSKQHTMAKHLQNAPNHSDIPTDYTTENIKLEKQAPEKPGVTKNKYVCCLPKCAKEFTTEGLLLEHCAVDHSGKRRENEAERTSDANVCPGCCKSFENATCLVWHRFTRFTKQYACRFCGQTFSRWSANREHENIVHLRKTSEFPCETCGKVFLTAQRLKAHREIHSDLRQQVCGDCGASFRNKGVLKRHRRAVHSNDYPFDCKLCPKKFPTQEQLNAHMRVHTGAKPYPCRFCERAFAHFTDRKRHEMSTHTGERPFQCPHCPAAYIRNRELAIHMQKHTEDNVV